VNAMSGHVHIIAYMRLPTRLWYGTVSMSLFSAGVDGQSVMVGLKLDKRGVDAGRASLRPYHACMLHMYHSWLNETVCAGWSYVTLIPNSRNLVVESESVIWHIGKWCLRMAACFLIRVGSFLSISILST
jgi:hypothetical protein